MVYFLASAPMGAEYRSHGFGSDEEENVGYARMSKTKEQIIKAKKTTKRVRKAVRASRGDETNWRAMLGEAKCSIASDRDVESRKSDSRRAGKKNRSTGKNISDTPCHMSVDKGMAYEHGRKCIGLGLKGKWSCTTCRDKAIRMAEYAASDDIGTEGREESSASKVKINGAIVNASSLQI